MPRKYQKWVCESARRACPLPQLGVYPSGRGSLSPSAWRKSDVTCIADSFPTQSDAGLACLLVTASALTPRRGGTSAVRRYHDASQLHASTPSLHHLSTISVKLYRFIILSRCRFVKILNRYNLTAIGRSRTTVEPLPATAGRS